MKPNSFQQEILIITGTTFASRQICEKDENTNASSMSESEQLQNACWNGLLPDMLPEIMIAQNHCSNPVYLWQIREAESFLELEISDEPIAKDKYFSLNPHYFLSTQHYS